MKVGVSSRMKALALLLFICCLQWIQAADTVKILFVYGSKPLNHGESRWFGGIHGGHVSVSYNNHFVSFVPNGKFRVFPRRKAVSAFVEEYEGQFVFDTTDSRYLMVSIPVTAAQRRALDSVCKARLDSAEYEYGFFGMRCASAAYDVLSASGIVRSRGRTSCVIRYFYPKKLRKYMLKMANRNSWPMFFRWGRDTRRWESD